VFANRFGGGVTPEAGAVRVKRQVIRNADDEDSR